MFSATVSIMLMIEAGVNVQSPAAHNNMIDQWTFLVETVEVDGYNLRPGMTVFATLIGERIFDRAMYWVADSIDWK